MTEPSAVTRLISEVSRIRDDAWSQTVRRRTGLCLLDSLACFSAGLSLEHFAPSKAAARSLFGLDSNQCVSDSRPSPFAVAYLYGQAANSLDYDDTLLGHPGSPIVGAVLSIGQCENLSVDRLLRGIAAGYEAHWLFSAASVPSPDRAALVRSVGVWDTVAASVGVGVALGASDVMLERMLGVAVAHSLLPYTAKWYERPVPAMKNNLGWAAAGAILAAELAAAGQTGVTNALEGENGMWRMAGSDEWNLTRVPTERAAVLRTGFKAFPVCWFMQQYMNAMSTLLSSIETGDDIVDIVLYGPREVERFCDRRLLGSADIAFSFPAVFSLLITGVEPGPAWDTIDAQSDALRYRDRFSYVRAEQRSIVLRTRLGREFNAHVSVSDPFDNSHSGLDEQGVLRKYARLCNAVLRDEALDALEMPGDRVPRGLYDAVEQLIRREHH